MQKQQQLEAAAPKEEEKSQDSEGRKIKELNLKSLR